MKMNDNVKTETLFLNVSVFTLSKLQIKVQQDQERQVHIQEKLLTFYFIKYRLLYLQFES